VTDRLVIHRNSSEAADKHASVLLSKLYRKSAEAAIRVCGSVPPGGSPVNTSVS